MSDISNQEYLLKEQYKDATNLNARIQLHARFSTNKYGWSRWVFDQLKIGPGSRILELGCGPGGLWKQNLDRIPADWNITLSDFSPGMLQEAEHNLNNTRPFTFAVIDAQAIPYENETFDAVIANHMLYHVPDRAKAISEIRRVLKPRGRVYASTIGQQHLKEIDDLINKAAGIDLWGKKGKNPFILENGGEDLRREFAHVTLYRHDDELIVTEEEPLIAYILSGRAKKLFEREKLQMLRELIHQEMVAQGALHITRTSGSFEAYND